MRQPKNFNAVTTFIARFGCGFLIGGLITALWFRESFATAFLIGGVLCGLCAWIWGDRFWEWFVKWIR